jgi:hypothetical protein
MRKPYFFVIIGVFISTAAPAWATEYLFSARIDQANALYAVGTMIEGRFGYNSALFPTRLISFDYGAGAEYDDPSIFIEATFGADTFSTRAIADVFDDLGEDGDGLAITGFAKNFTLQLGFEDPTSKVFTALGLPTGQLPPLAQGPFPDANDDNDLTVPSATFGYYDTRHNLQLEATVLSIRAATSPAPEPATWAMFIVGFGFLGAGMRYRRRAELSAG